MLSNCSNQNDKEFEAAANKLYKEYCNDWGVYNISKANRFGGRVISIFCISNDDRDRLDKLINDPYEGFHIHFTSPIWGIGGLNKENLKKFKEMLADPENVTYGTEKYNAFEKYQDEIIQEDNRIWKAMSDSQKKIWISNYIKNRRKRIPKFANCGDKFLLPE